MRGTFANVRIRNEMLDDVEGGFTKFIPTGEQMAIYDAAMKYQADGTPSLVIAGKEYGSGSSRDWAAKGPSLLGVHAVLVMPEAAMPSKVEATRGYGAEVVLHGDVFGA